MPRAYQVFSAVVATVSLVLLLHTLSTRFTYPGEGRTVFKSNDEAHLGPNADRSRTIQHDSRPSDPPYRANQERASSPAPFSRRIVAIGDLHGDFKRSLEILQIAGVVDEDGHWTGKFHLMVQTGDIIDREPDTMKLYEYMEQLRKEAQEAGGNVLSLFGNHEFFALTGTFKFAHPQDLKSFGGPMGRVKELRNGIIGKWWAEHYQIALRVPFQAPIERPNTPYDPNEPSQSPFSSAALSFVHGGLPPEYPYLTPFPTAMNEFGHSMLVRALSWDDDYTDEELSVVEERKSPLDYRGWAEDAEPDVCADVEEVLHKTGTRRMIMGHTPQTKTKAILSRCDGKILVIDTGISSYFIPKGGVQSVLTIEYTLTPAPELAVGSNGAVWIEQEVIKAIYVDHEEKLVDSTNEVTGNINHL